MPRINADCCFQERSWIGKFVGQAHRLPKELHGNRERLSYRNAHSYVPRFSSHFQELPRCAKMWLMADDRW
jgi:hypothetical protein